MKNASALDRVRSAAEFLPLDRAGIFRLLSKLCEGSGLHLKRTSTAALSLLFPSFVSRELDLDRGSGSLLSAGSGRDSLSY